MTTELAPFASDEDDHEQAVRATTTRRLRARSLGRADAAQPSEVVHLRLINDAELPYERPRVRGDCAEGERPCPFVGCKHNLYLDYNKATGNILLNFPDREPWQMPHDGSCALDVAEQGGVTLNAAGEYVNLTRERIRQVENSALRKLRNPPTIGRNGSALADGVAALRAYADHQSHSPCSLLGEQMLETTSDVSEEDDADVRRFKADLPHILDESVSDDEYCASLHRIWDQWRADRQALSRGELHVIQGQYVSARHVKVLEAIRDSCRDHGHPPSIMEIADIAEVKGSTVSTRRQNASAILRSLRELGLLEGKRGQIHVAEGIVPPPTTDTEMSPVEELAQEVAE